MSTLRRWLRAGIDRSLSSPAMPEFGLIPFELSVIYDLRRLSRGHPIRTILDVGANVGDVSEAFHRAFPEASIHAFEPSSIAFDLLKTRMNGIEHVHCHQVAVGAAEGKREMHVSNDTAQNTFVTIEKLSLPQQDELVEITTLDAFAASHAIERVDVLKMDVQGWEMEVLKGARRILHQKRVDFIYSEVCFSRHDAEMTYFGDLNDVVQQAGYGLCGFYERNRRGPNGAWLRFANALFQVCA